MLAIQTIHLRYKMLPGIFLYALKTRAAISLILGFSVGIGLASHLFTEADIGRERLDWLLLALLTVIGTVAILQNRALNLASRELQRWQDMFKYTKWGIAVSSADGLTLEQVNPAFASLHGFTVEELAGQPILDMLAPQCRDGLAAYIQTARQQGPHIFEAVHVHKDGHPFPVEIDISPVYGTDGAIRHRILSVKDISAHKQSEKLFNSIVEHVPVMIFLKNAKTLRFELINRTAEEVMGYSRQEMLGKTDYDFFPEKEADFFTGKDREVLESKHILNIAEEPIQTQSGKARILQTIKTGLYDDEGNATHLLGVSLDITERKQVETALRLSEASLKRAQSVAQIGSWALDIRTNLLGWTAEIYRIFGIPEHTPLSYETFLACVHPDDRNYVDRMWKRALAGEIYDIEHRVLVNGEVRWVREKADLEMDADGQVIGCIGITQDITERKRSESILRESEEKLRGLFELSPLGIALTDMQGRYLEFNRAFRRITGYTAEELHQLDYWRLTPSKYAAEEAWQLECLNKTGQYGPYEKEYVHKNGNLTPLRLNGILLEGRGGEKYIWSIVEDISERRQTEEQLRTKRSERRRLLEIQASILDALPANIALIDQQGIIRQTNRRWLSFALKYGADEAKVGVGSDYLSVCDQAAGNGDPDAGRIAQEVRQILAGENNQFSCEYPCHQPNQKHWFLLQVVSIPINNRSGAVVMHLDITDSKNAEIALSQSRQQLRAMAAQTEMTREQERKRIAREVHDELGQNLTALRMDVSLLRLQFGADNPDLLERLKGTLKLVDRAIKNVRNVATNLRPAALDMGLLDSLKWLCSEFTEHSGILCKLHYTDDSCLIDEPRAVQIFRIMQESLTNIARHAHASQVDVTLRCHEHKLCLDVHDNGIGFDSAKQNQKSFGLLGIRERAIVLGGDVDIMSTLGQGTTVSLQIPLE